MLATAGRPVAATTGLATTTTMSVSASPGQEIRNPLHFYDMSRIFINKPLSEHSEISLTGEEHHYIKNVLRMRPGDPLFLFNGNSIEYHAKIAHIYKHQTIVEITQSENINKESPLKIIIAQALPKGNKLDELIPRITELGVSSLIPLISERSDRKKVSPHKIERWRKIATHAAEQTGRTVVPHISSPVSFLEFMKNYASIKKILFYELEQSKNFKSILEKDPFTNNQILCFIIGPEGGFSPKEISLATKENCIIASLGKRILRTQTVAPAVCAIAQYVWGDLNHL